MSAEADLLGLARSRLQREVLERRAAPLVLRVVRSTARPAACFIDISIPGVFHAAIEVHRRATHPWQPAAPCGPRRRPRPPSSQVRYCVDPEQALHLSKRRRCRPSSGRLPAAHASVPRPDVARRVSAAPAQPWARPAGLPGPPFLRVCSFVSRRRATLRQPLCISAPDVNLRRDPLPPRRSLLMHLDSLPPAERLPRLVRWLSTLDHLFVAPCSHCGQLLGSSTGSPLLLMPPTVRTARGESLHPECYAERHGAGGWESGWLGEQLLV